MKKASIIIPVYNVKKYLPKCIESALNQDFENYEIILIDDGSTDGSDKIVDEYAEQYPNIVVAIHQENKGLGGARNTGIDNSKGTYLIFLDSDDYLEKDTLSYLYNYAEEKGADLVMYNMRTVREDGHVIRENTNNLSSDVFSLSECKELLLGQISASSKFYHRDIFVKNNIRFPEHRWFEDVWVTYPVFYVSKRVVATDKVFYNYLMRSGSIMNNQKIDRNIEIIEAYDSARKYYVEKKCFEQYKDELEYVTTYNAFIGTSIRVMLVDSKSIILKELREYMRNYYPNFLKNRYLSKLEKLLAWMIKHKMYFFVTIAIKIKRKLEGYTL